LWLGLLAPAFCLGLIYAKQRRLIQAWAIVFIILIVVAIMKHVPQPWKGIIDGGVVLGLVWGLGVIWWLFIRALVKNQYPPPQDLPQGYARD
jgi:hypothetical protein